ncbi:hypothetical protein [Couchioplanes azureus]|uniref:hypothetical protein n=1 Tax=Couchioplanes caeruleus TaxID=56438 RepID=UPI001670F7F6|nr:hypothetical protein [Couchioplanes caeruleus]GGQ68207.1 hypothetical protein GCM10010166_42790 [Couchioplanes caeruleus subsp. azureus]
MSLRFHTVLIGALVALCLAVGLGVLVHSQARDTTPPSTAVVAPSTPPSDPNGSCVSCT